MNIVLLAPPAAGKGTMSELLIKKYGFTHISTGDLLRNALSRNDEIAKSLKETMDAGKLVDDETILKLVYDKLSSSDNKGFIFDGFPRTINQAIAFDKMLSDMDNKVDTAIYITVPKEVALKRTTGRITCPSCKRIYNIYFDNLRPKNSNICDECGVELIKRGDDSEEVFEKRYATYLKETEPLVNYYQEKGILKEVENINKEEAFRNITTILENL